MFLPVRINNALTVMAMWTKGSDNESFGYISQLWKYLQIHGRDVSEPGTLVLGDPNSNTIWGKPDCWWDHSGVVSELAALGLQSLYHSAMQEPHGKESVPTFFLQRNLHKPYHIDYVFASADLLPACSLHVGSPTDWLHLSDHVPLMVNLER